MQTFFKFNLHKIPQAEPINYWKCYDWEMDLFEEIPHTEMFEIIQVKYFFLNLPKLHNLLIHLIIGDA